MAGEEPTLDPTAAMVVDVGSPTEPAEDSEDLEPIQDAVQVKMEKRKRENPSGIARPVPEESDREFDSPSKHPSRGDDKPITARELRGLLAGHVSEMKVAWGNFQTRLDNVEISQARTSCAMHDLQARTTVVEKDVAQQRAVAQETSTSLDNLAAEVKNMKVRIDELQERPTSADRAVPNGPGPPPDPWAEFLRNRDSRSGGQVANTRPTTSTGVKSAEPQGDRGDVLTEDEKRTLVIGGWLQDTKRTVIEEESIVILEHEEIKSLIDSEKLAIYGPRRSVGMLKFVLREGENEHGLKERMWKVIRIVARLRHPLPSTRLGGDPRTLWAGFVKTRNARVRSSHVSMVRRVTMALAKESNAGDAAGVIANVNMNPTSYDCDWNMGTIWCGAAKLASSSHRAPRDEEVITMSGGWVSLSAVAKSAACSACSTDEAKRAFELEL